MLLDYWTTSTLKANHAMLKKMCDLQSFGCRLSPVITRRRPNAELMLGWRRNLTAGKCDALITERHPPTLTFQ